MKEISEITACVVDNGLFVPLAQRLAKDCKRVLYWSEYEDAFATLKKACFGLGVPGVERLDDIWSSKDEIDLFVFPDVQHAGMQLELQSQGYPVWGSRRADSLELDRDLFVKTLLDCGLEIAPYQVIEGISKLREALVDQRDKYIKISRWRGDFETAHWRDWDSDKALLDVWSLELGPLAEVVRFLVFDSIETELEIGADGYCVDGQWPKHMLNGLEFKDKGYFGVVTKTERLPEQIRQVLECFGPILKNYGYRNQFSSEIRVAGDHFYFIDPTCRGGLPSTSSQLELWKNFSEIVWAGAQGELVEPIPAGKFSMECVLTTKWPKNGWASAKFPEELQDAAKISCCAYLDGTHVLPPHGWGDEIGWLVAIGNTPRECLKNLQDKASALPDGVCGHIHSIVGLVKEIETAQSQGIPVTKEPLPTPGEIVEET